MKTGEMIHDGGNERGLFARTKWVVFFASCVFGLTACREGEVKEKLNQELAGAVDLGRFMGRWYVHGYTPTFLDKHAVNATETYKLNSDGKLIYYLTAIKYYA